MGSHSNPGAIALVRIPTTRLTAVHLDLLILAASGLPRNEKQRLADWLDGLSRGIVGPITESLAELQIEILQQLPDVAHGLRAHMVGLLARTEPELVGDVIQRTITELGRALRSSQRSFTEE